MDIKGRSSQKKKTNVRFSDIRPPVTKTGSSSTNDKPAQEAPSKETVKKPRYRTVEINLSLPKIKLPSREKIAQKTRRLYDRTPKKKVAIIGSIITGLVIVYFAALALLHQGSLFVDAREGDFDSAKVVEKPSFGTILPNGKEIEELGGWKRVSPPKSAAVYAYADTIDGHAIQVSQQEVPEEFKPNIDENVAQMAHDFGAKDKFTAGGLTIYIGQTFKGKQSVIFRKNDLLVLMRSDEKLTNKAWGKYALSLR